MKCTTVKTASAITRAQSGRAKELLSLINAIDVPYVPAVGDICFYDSGAGALRIVNYGKWSADPSAYPSSQYTPIGVVVIPSAHNVYGTGKCAVMSLKFMSCDTPDEGSVSGTHIYWGQYGVNTELPDMDRGAYTGTCDAPGSEIVGVTAATYLPSDDFSAVACPTDPKAFYYYDSSEYYAAPSPYLEDGSRNPAYYQTESPSSGANGLADFDGAGNTEALCGLATAQADWKTDGTIANNSDEGYSPAACCCWRFHTDGTGQGDWYFPAMGELCYAMVRRKAVNATIDGLLEVYGNAVGARMGTDGFLKASTEAGAYAGRRLNIQNGTAGQTDKNGEGYARAFLRV